MEPQQSPSTVQVPPDARQQRARSGATRHDSSVTARRSCLAGTPKREASRCRATDPIAADTPSHRAPQTHQRVAWRGHPSPEFLQHHHRREGALLLPAERCTPEVQRRQGPVRGSCRRARTTLRRARLERYPKPPQHTMQVGITAGCAPPAPRFAPRHGHGPPVDRCRSPHGAAPHAPHRSVASRGRWP